MQLSEEAIIGGFVQHNMSSYVFYLFRLGRDRMVVGFALKL